MLSILGGVVSGIFGIGKSYMQERREIKAAEHERTLKQISGEQEWDNTQAANSRDSWKDEYITLIFTTPFVLLFVGALFDLPWLLVRVKEAMNIVDKDIPTEYWYLLSVIVAASMGVKGVIAAIKRIREGK